MKNKVNFLRAAFGSLVVLGSMTPASAATMAVNVSFTDIGSGIFRYDLIISNTGLTDIPLLSINDAPANEALIGSSLTIPAGFVGNYDPMGIIDFTEDTTTFIAGNTFPGFSFQSTATPGSAFTNFSGFDNDGAPVAVTVTQVPEPSSAFLVMVGLLAGCNTRRR